MFTKTGQKQDDDYKNFFQWVKSWDLFVYSHSSLRAVEIGDVEIIPVPQVLY